MAFASLEEKKAYDKKYYLLNREKILARSKAWRESHAEYLSEWQKAYRESHKETNALYKKEYYYAHKKEDNDRCKAWRAANKERKKISDKAAYEARKREGICLNCGKISKLREKFCSHKCYREWVPGEHSGTWRGGLSFEPYCPKFSRSLKRRIRSFFDNQCLLCGKTTEENGKQLACHHVEYNKQACCDGKPVQFAALCLSCHGKTNHETARWESMIHRIIDEIYNGRSYYTKEEYESIIR